MAVAAFFRTRNRTHPTIRHWHGYCVATCQVPSSVEPNKCNKFYGIGKRRRGTAGSLNERSSMQASFWKAGHPPTLFAAFLYFDVSFMVWVLLGPLGVQIAQTLQISPAEKGLMVATPVLAGA